MIDPNDSKSKYLQDLISRNIPQLTFERERELAIKISDGDQEALDELVYHNLPLVPFVVTKLSYWDHSKTPQEDILGIGNEALILAAKKWKPQKKYRFPTYARSFIARYVQRELDNTSNIIRIPINIVEEIKRMNYQTQVLTQMLGRKPTIKEVAEVMGTTTKRLHQLRVIINREPSSLDHIEKEYEEEKE